MIAPKVALLSEFLPPNSVCYMPKFSLTVITLKPLDEDLILLAIRRVLRKLNIELHPSVTRTLARYIFLNSIGIIIYIDHLYGNKVESEINYASHLPSVIKTSLELAQIMLQMNNIIPQNKLNDFVEFLRSEIANVAYEYFSYIRLQIVNAVR